MSVAIASAHPHRPIYIWLFTMAILVALMVVIGGVTRLTGSGLSMVEWRPLMGTLPPLSEAEWQRVFLLYQQSPEYQEVNWGMSLAAFKQIFFWEYVHRLWGRLLGLAFGLPLIWFWLRKQIPAGYGAPLFGLLILGGLLLALLLGWVVPGRFRKDLSESSTPLLQQRLLLVMLRWVSPPVVATGLVISVVDLLKG